MNDAERIHQLEARLRRCEQSRTGAMQAIDRMRRPLEARREMLVYDLARTPAGCDSRPGMERELEMIEAALGMAGVVIRTPPERYRELLAQIHSMTILWKTGAEADLIRQIHALADEAYE